MSPDMSSKKDIENIPPEMTVAQALKEKYVNQQVLGDRLVLPKDKKISTDITFVGFGTVSCVQKQLKRLANIDLSGKNIKSAGRLDDLKGSLHQVTVLNLANNYVTWNEVIPIISCFSNLQELILSQNPLIDEKFSNGTTIEHKRLKSLTLGRVHSDWTSIVNTLFKIWSSVEQLDLWDSQLNNHKMNLTDIQALDPFVSCIRSLKLSHNSFTDMNWISNIGTLEKLEELDLSKCNLECINIDESLASSLNNLKVLNVSYNHLSDWRSISSLHYLKRLRCLICHENPIYVSTKSARQMTIGRLSRITVLNREEIDRNSRRDSEIFYLRHAYPEYLLYMQGSNQDFRIIHPRYQELIDSYGIPDDLTKNQMIEKYISVELCLGSATIAKKLPLDMRIANLRMLCKRLFRLRPSSTIEITCSDADKELDYKLDQDGQTLHFFSVKNKQRLLIRVVED